MRHGAGGAGKIAKNNIVIYTGERHILDHVSLSWSHSNLMGIQRKSDQNPNEIRDITIQRTLFADAFWDHPTGLLIFGNDESGNVSLKDWLGLKNIDIHHNAFANVGWRTPEVSGNGIRLCNNIQYNFSYRATTFKWDSKLDICNNTVKAGPMTPSGSVVDLPYRHRTAPGVNNLDWTPSLYVVGNKVIPTFLNPQNDNWSLLATHETGLTPLPLTWKRTTPHPQVATFPVAIQSADEAYNSILTDVGDNKRLDCAGNWVSRQDRVDERAIDNIKNGTGYKRQDGNRPGADDPLYKQYVVCAALEPGYGIDAQTGAFLKGPPTHWCQIGGYPPIAPGTACLDSDHDGMPNEFEVRYNLNPNSESDQNQDHDNDGYPNIEEYLNGTHPRQPNT
jgi:hypothetical protein